MSYANKVDSTPHLHVKIGNAEPFGSSAPTGILESIRQLDISLSNLNCILAELKTKLEPVLLPSEPSLQEASIGIKTAQSSVNTSIETLAYFAENIEDQVRSLTKRVDL